MSDLKHAICNLCPWFIEGTADEVYAAAEAHAYDVHGEPVGPSPWA